MNAFLAIDGYGAYIWPAYGLALAMMVFLLARNLSAYRAAKRRFLQLSDPES